MDVNKSVSTLMAPTCVPVEVDTDFQLMATVALVGCGSCNSELPNYIRRL